MSKTIKILTLLIFTMTITACVQDKSKKIEKTLADESIIKAEKLKKDFNKAKQVFYSLPSPIETAMLIKRSGVQYNPDFLNPESNKNKYVSTHNLAMALGIYTANMSYASIFSQSQTSIKYMSTAKEIADALGILDAIDKKTVERLENNINNRDSIMDIISSTFMNSDNFLKENGRTETAVLVITGGWIEGLYLATQHAKLTPDNEEIIDRIIDQKMSLQSLLQLMENYNNDKNINRTKKDLERINYIYNSFKVVSTDIKSVTHESERKTLLKAKTDIFYDKTQIEKLTEVVDSVRTAIVQPN